MKSIFVGCFWNISIESISLVCGSLTMKEMKCRDGKCWQGLSQRERRLHVTNVKNATYPRGLKNVFNNLLRNQHMADYLHMKNSPICMKLYVCALWNEIGSEFEERESGMYFSNVSIIIDWHSKYSVTKKPTHVASWLTSVSVGKNKI